MPNSFVNLLRSSGSMIATCFVAGLILAILAPYGTTNFTLPTRFLFWIGLCFAGGLGAALAEFLLKKSGRAFSPPIQAIALSLGASIVVAGHMLWLTLKFEGPPSIEQFSITFFYIWVVAITISGIAIALSHRTGQLAEEKRSPEIFERLPMHLRNSQIYALSAEDHYVRVITSKGEEMILMRLSDAIKEMSPLAGLSPHRSWWVAESGVEKLSKSNGKSELTLKSGQSVPISRNGMKTVREAGWS